MFIIKKIFNSDANRSKSNAYIQSDAFPVDGNVSQKLESNAFHEHRNNSFIYSTEVANSLESENNLMNVNNVNQQVVVQFSNINGLQIGSTYNINESNIVDSTMKKGLSQNATKLKYPKTITIDLMMKSEEEPNREILNEVATHLGSNYKSFMRELGFSDGQISTKNIDHSLYGVKEVIYQLLLDWIRNADDNGTVGYLTTMLWNSGHRECVYMLKSLWKSKAFEKTNVDIY